jgi:hypothetical protein
MNHPHGTSNVMAASATLHCLTGCSIGEIVGMLISSAAGWGNLASIAIAFGLAFVFGYVLSSLPLVRTGLGLGAALKLVLAADTLSILTMEVVDNGFIALVPGALEAQLPDTLFWLSMALSLLIAFAAAFPVNRWLMSRDQGHALTHEYMGAEAAGGWRRFVPDLPTPALATAIGSFLLGALLVASVA